MLRKIALVLAGAAALVASTAAPASAQADPNTCRRYNVGTTAALICVDVTSGTRGVYVAAASGAAPTVLTIRSAFVRQCNVSSCGISGSSGFSAVSAPALLVQWIGAHGPYAFGHTYQACASIVVDSASYGTVCSGARAN